MFILKNSYRLICFFWQAIFRVHPVIKKWCGFYCVPTNDHLDTFYDRKALTKEDRKDFSKIAAWVIYLLKTFDHREFADKCYRYALYYIIEQLSSDDKLILLKHVYSDKNRDSEIEKHAKEYFKKFIHNNIIGIVFDDKIKYFMKDGKNNWSILPSNKISLTKDYWNYCLKNCLIGKILKELVL